MSLDPPHDSLGHQGVTDTQNCWYCCGHGPFPWVNWVTHSLNNGWTYRGEAFASIQPHPCPSGRMLRPYETTARKQATGSASQS